MRNDISLYPLYTYIDTMAVQPSKLRLKHIN